MPYLNHDRKTELENTRRSYVTNSLGLNPVQPIVSLKQQKCEYCGGIVLIPTGSCRVCQNCGTSQGCS